MKAAKTVFLCSNCGNETPRWQGQCPACGAWNSIVEFEDKKAPARQNAVRGGRAAARPAGSGTRWRNIPRRRPPRRPAAVSPTERPPRAVSACSRSA